MKKTILALACMASLVIMTACGGGSKKASDGTTNTKEVVSSKWPDTEHTKQVPKPEGITIVGNQPIDNVYTVGHTIVISDCSVATAKAYAEQLKKAGFTIPGSGSKDGVVEDDGKTFSFAMENSDGVYVNIYTNGTNGGISIQKSKKDN